MPGTVTVFNSYNEPVSNLAITNNAAGQIAGWATGTTPPQYTPSALVVPLSKYPATTAVFAYGDNAVACVWDSRTGNMNVNIPADLSIDDNLILYITQNLAILTDARGIVVHQTPVTISSGGAKFA